MKKLLRFELLIVLLGAVGITLFVFRQYFFEHKTLFPSNLLVSSYSPWKYESVPEYPNGPPNKPMGFDNIRQSYPDRKLLQNAFMKGVLPLWNPYIYSGAPFMAASDKAVWYPLSWIAAMLPTIEGWNFLVVIQPIASLFFMYLFLRSLKFRIPLAAFGSFVYALSGWMVAYWQEPLVLEHSFLWLPLALYASNRLWERDDDVLGFFLLLLALVSSVFGGFLQMSIYVYAVVLLWNIFCFLRFRGQRNVSRCAWLIFLAIICSILIESIQLIPSAQAFVLSPRGSNDGSFVFRDDLLPLRHIITLLAPDYWGNPATYNYFGGSGFYFEKIIFIGIIPLLFAIYGMIKTKQKTIVFWTVLGLVCFSMGFALPTSWLLYYLHIPILSTSYPTRILAVSAFSFSILSCYGLEAFLRDPERKRMMYILAGLSVILAAGWAVVISAWCIHGNTLRCIGLTSVTWGWIGTILFTTKDTGSYVTVSLRNLIVPTAFLLSGWGLVLVSRFFKRLVFILVCVLTIASSLYFVQKYVYFSENRFVYPNLPVITKLTEFSGYDRVWGYGNAFIEKNFSEYFQWFSTDGYSNLSSSRYAELISTIVNNGKLGGVIRRSDTDLYEASERDPFGSSNPYRLRMMSLFGVKYVLEAKKGTLKDTQLTEVRFPPEIFANAWEDDTWRIWQYKPALPRVMFVKSYIVRNDSQQIIDALYDPKVRLDATVVLESVPTMPPSAQYSGNQRSSAAITSYELNSVTVSTSSPVAGFALLTDNYYPGWIATIDGKPTQLYRADYTLRAVAVPKGEHVVIFRYTPVTFTVGSIIACIGVLLSVVAIVCMRRNPRRQKD
jgi:hypothetical protein